jgi:hypothetical protein
MNLSPNELWNAFIASFKKNMIASQNENSLVSLFKDKFINRTERTSFYKEDLFKKVAKDLDLAIEEKELLRVDIVLTKRYEGSWPVPIIFIESENDAAGELDREIFKLLSVNSPLKVLITYLNIEEEIKSEFEGHEDSYWYYLLRDFAKLNRLTGFFGVISPFFEDGKLCFHYVVYDDSGNLVGNLQKFYLN